MEREVKIVEFFNSTLENVQKKLNSYIFEHNIQVKDLLDFHYFNIQTKKELEYRKEFLSIYE